MPLHCYRDELRNGTYAFSIEESRIVQGESDIAKLVISLGIFLRVMVDG